MQVKTKLSLIALLVLACVISVVAYSHVSVRRAPVTASADTAQGVSVGSPLKDVSARGVFIYANNEALFYPLEVLRGEVLDGELQGVAFRIDPTAPEANMVSFTGSQKLPYELLPYSEAVFQFPEVRVYEVQ